MSEDYAFIFWRVMMTFRSTPCLYYFHYIFAERAAYFFMEANFQYADGISLCQKRSLRAARLLFIGDERLLRTLHFDRAYAAADGRRRLG